MGIPFEPMRRTAEAVAVVKGSVIPVTPIVMTTAPRAMAFIRIRVCKAGKAEPGSNRQRGQQAAPRYRCSIFSVSARSSFRASRPFIYAHLL